MSIIAQMRKKIRIRERMQNLRESYFLLRGIINRFFYREPTILNGIESTKKIIESNRSLARFGDGEFVLIYGQSIGFQTADTTLGQRLKNVLETPLNNLEIGIPDAFDNLKTYRPKVAHFWKIFMGKNRAKILSLLNLKRTYCNTNMTRFWTAYKDRSKVPEIVAEFKKLWENRDVIFVEGEYSRLGVGNDLFNNARSIQRILCPAENAWNKYDEILSAITNVSKNHPEALYILALGPTATVLAYDMCKMGLWAVDLGHIDVQYEYMLRNAQEKIALPGKYVNENPDGKNVSDCIVTKEYTQSILCKII